MEAQAGMSVYGKVFIAQHCGRVLVSGLEVLTIMGSGVVSVVGASGVEKVRRHKQFYTKECLERM